MGNTETTRRARKRENPTLSKQLSHLI